MLSICPKCGSREIRPLGVGTQRLENEIKKMFPMSKIKRLDRDSIKKKEIIRIWLAILIKEKLIY